MKRVIFLISVFAGGLLATSVPAFAQSDSTPPPNYFMGKVTMDWLSRDTVASSKFQEYREVPKGVSMPEFTLQGRRGGNAFSLFGKNISQTDTRYTGRASTAWMGVSFDYNQIPHSMGNDGHSILTNLAPGVWSMSGTLRQALGDKVAATATAARTFPFYAGLYAPTIAAAGPVNLTAMRQRGSVEVALGQKLPFDLFATYLRDVKTGTRGAGGGYIRSFVDNIVEVPEPLNEVTQDAGFRAAVNRAWGNVHASFGHNWYNDRQETLVVDNPLVAFDQPYVASPTPATGGTSRARFINPPDNAANTTSFGALFKFARQTRVFGDVSVGRWTQNAQLYPYTIFSTSVTGTGLPADQTSSLQAQSLNGKIHTTTANVAFSSRPIDHLGVRARFRRYEFANKTTPIVWTGSFAGSPDRVWANTNLTTDQFGYATASPYGYTTDRFDLSASYDIRALTFEGAYREVKIDRTYREGLQGTTNVEAEATKETGGTVAAILRTTDWLNVRASYDQATRKPEGAFDPALTRLQSDLSGRDSTRAGVDVEISPNDQVTFILAYARRNADYKNPNAVVGVAGTAYGLINAKYDTWTGEFDLTPGDRGQVNFYYTHEKNISTTQSFSGGTTLLGLLKFAGSDKTDTYGANVTYWFVPEKYAFRLMGRHQRLDGLMNVTGDPAGPFALARATIGGIQDIDNYSDTKILTATAEFDWSVASTWGLTFGYRYENYSFSDAFSFGNELYPLSGAFYLKANDGAYKVNIAYTRLNFRF